MIRKGNRFRVGSDKFNYHNGLIDQMYRTQEVLKAVEDPHLARELQNWHLYLGQVLLRSLAPATPPPNVDTSAADQDRANAMWAITDVVASDFDAGGTPDNTKRWTCHFPGS